MFGIDDLIGMGVRGIAGAINPPPKPQMPAAPPIIQRGGGQRGRALLQPPQVQAPQQEETWQRVLRSILGG